MCRPRCRPAPGPDGARLRQRRPAADLVLRTAGGVRPRGHPAERDGGLATTSQEAVIPAILALQRLGAGESLEWRVSWDQVDDLGEAVPPGEYLATGRLPTEPGQHLTSPPVRFLVLAAGSAATSPRSRPPP
jgi:hypothetical protein